MIKQIVKTFFSQSKRIKFMPQLAFSDAHSRFFQNIRECFIDTCKDMISTQLYYIQVD